MKKLKALVISVLILTLSIASSLTFTVFADNEIITDKTTYFEGEPIMVTATGSGKDWVGIQPKTSTITPSVLWYYITDAGSGTAFDIRNAGNGAQSGSADAIPAGVYIVYVVPNDQTASHMTESIEITVIKKPVTITLGADTVRLESSDDDLTLTASASGITGIKVNGSALNAESYTISGSSITLKASYLETLTAGNYNLTVLTENGDAATTLTVNTGDAMLILCIIGAASVITVFAVMLKRKKGFEGK